jgi:hypothetical protein
MQNLQPRKALDRLEVLTLQVEVCLDEQNPEELRAVLEAREKALADVLALESLTAAEVAQLVRVQAEQSRIFDKMKAEQAECEKGLIHMYASRQGRRAYRQG